MAEMVSVALPVYNGALYLEQQLDSILEQLEPQDEVVAAYQASADRSLEILESARSRDPRVKILRNTQSGITANFQLALQNCRGDFIFLCDQDDVWLPEKRRAVVEAFYASGADLVLHDAVHTDADLTMQEKTFFEIYSLGPGRWKNIKKPRMSGCCMALTASMRDKVLPLPEIHGYDQWIFVAAEFMGKIEYLHQVLLLHRLHGENSTTGTRRLDIVLRCRFKLLWHLLLRLFRVKLLHR